LHQNPRRAKASDANGRERRERNAARTKPSEMERYVAKNGLWEAAVPVFPYGPKDESKGA